jgi:ketosteroid isomerase-like protein
VSKATSPEELFEALAAGLRAGDLEGVLALYEPDAAFVTPPTMPPGTVSNAGPDLRNQLSMTIARKHELDYELTDVIEANDLALVIGVWSLPGEDTSGKAIAVPARFVDVLRRQDDGSWRFAIGASVALGEWPESVSLELLADVRSVVHGTKRPRISSQWLVTSLKNAPNSLWADFRGVGLTTHMLARMLKAFELEPHAFNTREEGWFRGYALSDLQDAFRRYLPPASGC